MCLKELGRILHEKFGLPVVMITFNGWTPLTLHERDPLQSVLNRIAYSVCQDGTLVWNDFFGPNFSVSSETIHQWVGSNQCVLLIDELNKLMVESSPALKEVSTFLKSTFLDTHGRYFIFTSHVSDTTTKLAAYMSSPSDRDVVVAQLPLRGRL